MWLEQIIFYISALALIGFSLAVIIVPNPVHAALSLVLAFFASAVLWFLLESEFLALILILVYVGAVMTLFLFVVMTLNLDIVQTKQGFVRYLPLGVLLIVLGAAAIIFVVGPLHFGFNYLPAPPPAPVNYSNVTELGSVLYTQYVYPFELSAILLLVAIIAAITLSLRKPRSKKQDINEQLKADPTQRLQIIKMKSEETQRGLP